MRLIKTVVLSLILVNFSFAEFDPCKFNFGTDWDWLSGNQSSATATNIDYVTIWLVDATYQGRYGSMLDFCKQKGKTPVFYAYIIAKAAALGDANVGGKLNTLGAAWLKDNFNNVKNDYQNWAQNIASKFGTDKPVIFLMEPDYYQYFSGNQSVSLTFQDAGNYMSQLITVIKTALPNAMFSFDISAWIEDQKKTSSWYNALPLNQASFINCSGGESQAASDKIKGENQMTWSGVSGVTNKGIIADCGYAAGGTSTGFNSAWNDVNNLRARIANGVVAITQKNPDGNWGNSISTLRTQLANETIKSCGDVGVKCTLTVNTGTGGTVTKTPDGTSFAQGAQVTLTAQPTTGYTFKNWSGDTTSTNSTIKVTLNKSKTISAVFEQIPANSFTLTVNIVGSGSVAKSPEQAYYQSGTQVTLTASPIKGLSAFKSWSGGGLSGSSTPATLTITANTTVTATFEDTAKSDTVKVEAESFTQKNGDNIKTETNGTVTSIGYIENGNSTTYNVNIDISGLYTLVFRVGTGLSSTSFSISVDGTNKGTVNFNGTVDNWTTFQDQTLSGTVQLNQGTHTIQLNYGAALNVDYFLAVLQSVPVIHNTVKLNSKYNVSVSTTKGGLIASFPSGSHFKSYSLYDFKGRMVRSGLIKSGVSQLSLANLNKDVWILKLNGSQNSVSVRAAVIK